MAGVCLLLLALAAWAAPSAGAAGSIYWSTTGGAIQVGNLDGSGSPTTLFSGENGPLGVAIDPAANKIYWGNFDAIRVGNLDGSGSAANVFGGQANPSGVAIDPAANKIYWGDTINAVRVGNLDGSGAPTNLFTEPDLGGGIEGQPLGVAIDPAANRIYWTDFAHGFIRAGNLDGSGSASTLFPDGSNPRGIAIHPAGGKLYWANAEGESRSPGNPSRPGFQPRSAVDVRPVDLAPGGVDRDPPRVGPGVREQSGGGA